MVSPGNRHCVSSIDALSFPIYTGLAKKVRLQTHGHNFVKSQPIYKIFHWKICWQICRKLFIKIHTTPCICCLVKH